MGLITYQNLENNTPATANMFNERFGAIVQELNGNLDGSNFKPGGISLEAISLEVFSRAWPIGSVYENADDDTNPSILLGFGTWAPFAAGRTTVGKAPTGTFGTIGAEVGTETVSLTAAQNGTHAHTVDPPATGTSGNGNHTHRINIAITTGSGAGGDIKGVNQASNGLSNHSSTESGNHSHSVDIPAFSSHNSGNGEAHNNIQPSVVTYKWKRTA